MDTLALQTIKALHFVGKQSQENLFDKAKERTRPLRIRLRALAGAQRETTAHGILFPASRAHQAQTST